MHESDWSKTWSRSAKVPLVNTDPADEGEERNFQPLNQTTAPQTDLHPFSCLFWGAHTAAFVLFSESSDVVPVFFFGSQLAHKNVFRPHSF